MKGFTVYIRYEQIRISDFSVGGKVSRWEGGGGGKISHLSCLHLLINCL